MHVAGCADGMRGSIARLAIGRIFDCTAYSECVRDSYLDVLKVINYMSAYILQLGEKQK